MRPKTRTIPGAEYDAIAERIYKGVEPIAYKGSAGTAVFIVTGEFEPTQNLAEARWIMTDNPYDMHLLQVDGAGDAILLIPER